MAISVETYLPNSGGGGRKEGSADQPHRKECMNL